MRVEFRKEGEGAGGIGGKKRVDLLCGSEDIGVESGKDFFVLFGIVMLERGGDVSRGEAEDRCVGEVLWRSGADFSLVREDWDGEFDHS